MHGHDHRFFFLSWFLNPSWELANGILWMYVFFQGAFSIAALPHDDTIVIQFCKPMLLLGWMAWYEAIRRYCLLRGGSPEQLMVEKKIREYALRTKRKNLCALAANAATAGIFLWYLMNDPTVAIYIAFISTVVLWLYFRGKRSGSHV